MDTNIDPNLIDRFDKAALLKKNGSPHEAIKIYDGLLETIKSNENINSLGEFLAHILIRKAYCLMDIGRFQEAKVIFESEELAENISKIHQSPYIWYLFSYGTTLGNLGLIDRMYEILTRAENFSKIAMDDNSSFTKMVWKEILHWGKENQDWEFLKKHSEEAIKIGEEKNESFISYLGDMNLCFAYNGLGLRKEAKKASKALLKKIKKNKRKDMQNSQIEDLKEISK